MPTTNCTQVKNQYKTIQDLQKGFDLELQKLKPGDDLSEAKELKNKLKQEINSLQEILNPFEKLLNMKEKYEAQVNTFKETGLVEKLENGEYGIKDEQGKEHSIPSMYEIIKRLLKNKEFYLEKANTMIKPMIKITPFALPLQKFKEKAEELILKKHKEGNLKGANGDMLEVDETQPVYAYSGFNNLLYFPEWVTEEDESTGIGGITKQEAIEQIGAFKIDIIEDIALVSEQGQTITSSKGAQRKQVDRGMRASEQYKLLKKQNEQGFTPEDWFAYFITKLSQENIVIYNNQDMSYYERLLGVRFGNSGLVPDAYWNRDCQRVDLGGGVSVDIWLVAGVRCAVGVGR